MVGFCGNPTKRKTACYLSAIPKNPIRFFPDKASVLAGMVIIAGFARSNEALTLAQAAVPVMMPKSKAKSKSAAGQEKNLLFNAPEVSFFIACLVMVKQLRGLARAFQNGEIAKGAFMEKSTVVLAQLTDTVVATERFDVVLPVMGYGQFSPFFWRWFNWWDDYFKGLTPMQVDEIERLGREQEPALEDYRPKDHWVNYRHTPAFSIVAG